MGLLQPDVRHGCRDGGARLNGPAERRPSGPVFVVNDLDQARAAVAAVARTGLPVVLMSHPAAAANAGVGWFRALVAAARAGTADASIEAIVDCGDMAGYAMSALRAGFRWVRLEGPGAAAVAAIAAERGATVLADRPAACNLAAAARAGRDITAEAAAWISSPASC